MAGGGEGRRGGPAARRGGEAWRGGGRDGRCGAGPAAWRGGGGPVAAAVVQFFLFCFLLQVFYKNFFS